MYSKEVPLEYDFSILWYEKNSHISKLAVLPLEGTQNEKKRSEVRELRSYVLDGTTPSDSEDVGGGVQEDSEP